MSVTVTYAAELSVLHTLTGPGVDPLNNTVNENAFNQSGTLTASSTVPATQGTAYELTLSSGSGSINLAALPGLTGNETIDGTGLKLQAVLLVNKATNANKIKVAKGASNGYGTCASGDDWSVTLSPGQFAMLGLADAAPDVASGARVLDITGTGSQVLQVQLVLG